MEDILPYAIYNALKKLNYKGVYELRLRATKPCVINYYNNLYYLSHQGITNIKQNAIICDLEDIGFIINAASNCSIYAINEQLKKGYLTIQGGIRIGIVGQVVTENDKVITVKNFSSLNIRFPHQILGVADNVMQYLIDNEDVCNTLIVSPAGAGKTTLLRDCVRVLSSTYNKNVLVIDERNEITSSVNGVMQMNLGDFCDVIVSSNKTDGFNNGIRSMCPDVIATDEIGTFEDFKVIEYAISCGVSVFATIHAKNINQLKQKQSMQYMIENKLFDRYIVLSNRSGKGTIEGVFNQDFINIME